MKRLKSQTYPFVRYVKKQALGGTSQTTMSLGELRDLEKDLGYFLNIEQLAAMPDGYTNLKKFLKSYDGKHRERLKSVFLNVVEVSQERKRETFVRKSLKRLLRVMSNVKFDRASMIDAMEALLRLDKSTRYDFEDPITGTLFSPRMTISSIRIKRSPCVRSSRTHASF